MTSNRPFAKRRGSFARPPAVTNLAPSVRVAVAAGRWHREVVSVAELDRIPTGPSEQDWLERVAAEHRDWLTRRPQDIRDAWEELGTWRVPPILISRSLLDPPGAGLQVVEGRMRVGILQGRRAAGLHVSASHEAMPLR